MQFSAHKIVSLFGSEALKALYTIENEAEIKICRNDWEEANKKIVCISSFNDGNNIFEVQADLDTMQAYRTDNSCDVTAIYADKVLKAYLDRNSKRALFGIDGIDFELIGKLGKCK